MKVLKYKYNPNKKGVFRISSVEVPAVGLGDLVLMSADIEPQEIKGVFYSPVMIPDIKITRIDPKTNEKYLVYYDAETVEQLCYNYWKQCGNKNTNLDHADENTEGIYPVESWIVKDSETDKSKALGMPEQKTGTWIMGYKVDNPEVLEKVKNNLLQGLSIEGSLDMEEDTDNPITKFNKHFMKKTPLEFAKHLANVIMSAVSDEEKPAEKTAEELAAEEEKKNQEMEAEKTPEEIEAEKKATEEEAPANEVETLKAEIELLKKDKADLEAELATFKNDAVLMSAQLEEVNKAFESYKTVKMSAQSLGNLENKKVDKPYSEMSNAEKTKYNRNN